MIKFRNQLEPLYLKADDKDNSMIRVYSKDSNTRDWFLVGCFYFDNLEGCVNQETYSKIINGEEVKVWLDSEPTYE